MEESIGEVGCVQALGVGVDSGDRRRFEGRGADIRGVHSERGLSNKICLP